MTPRTDTTTPGKDSNRAPDFSGWRVDLDPERGIWVPTLKLWFPVEGRLVVCFDEPGREIMTPAELRDLVQKQKAELIQAEARANTEKARADEANRQVQELQAELRRFRGETL